MGTASRGVGLQADPNPPAGWPHEQPQGRVRLGEERLAELVEDRKAGMQMGKLAQRYGISESSVKRLLRAHGVSRRQE